MFCVDCKKVVDENWNNHCESTESVVEGYKGSMHWYMAFQTNEIPEEYSWLKNYLKPVQQVLF